MIAISIAMNENEVLTTEPFSVSINKLFQHDPFYSKSENLASLEGYMGHYCTQSGRLVLEGEFWLGSVGIEGNITLIVPPAKKDIELLGYSVNKGEIDRWVFLTCLTIPENDGNVSIRLAYARNTFFDRPEDVVVKIDSKMIGDEVERITRWCIDQDKDESIEEAWNGLWRIFERILEAQPSSTDFNKALKIT